jgi:hypothetical protein
VKDGVRRTLKDRQLVLDDLVKAIREFRKFTDRALTLRGSDYATWSVMWLARRIRAKSKWGEDTKVLKLSGS